MEFQIVANRVKVVKCKAGQGKLNRMIAHAQKLLSNMGHMKRRFKRDYITGTAVYTCPRCGAIAVVTVDKQMEGTALTQPCSHEGEDHAES